MGLADWFRRLSVFLPLSLVVGLSVATLIALSEYGSSTVDALARGNMRERVEVALSVEEQRLAELLVQYAYRNAARVTGTDEPNPVRRDRELNRLLLEEVDVDLAFVVGADAKAVTGFLDGERAHPNVLEQAVSRARRGIADARADMQRAATRARYIDVDGLAYLLVVNRLAEDVESGKSDDTTIAFARRLDAERVAAIAALYRIPGLRLADTGRSPPPSLTLPLRDLDGATVAVLTWDDHTSAYDVRRNLRPYLVGAGVAFSGLIFWIFYLEIRSHREREVLLREMASVDQLTGIRNRREFFLDAGRKLADVIRARSTASVMLLDVDDFKQVNDTMGHATGDRILSLVAAHLRRETRDGDVFARYGGDEFVVLLPGLAAPAARPLAERLRKQVAEASSQATREGSCCTISIGIAEYVGGESLEQWISRADDALYRAKHAGRNRTVMANSGGASPDDTASPA